MTSYKDKPWVKRYDTGVPATLMPYPEIPLHQFLIDAAQRTPENVALLTSAHLPVVGRKKAEVTYRQLNEMSDAMAVALGELGVKKGDRVAIVMPNCAQFVISYFAILKAGAIVCATNPTYPAPKMASQLADCGATTVITITLFYNLLKEVQSKTAIKNVIVSNIKEALPPLAAFLFTVAKEKKDGHRVEMRPEDHSFAELLKRHAGKKPNVDVKPSDVAIFQYTGGTTGVPKAAMSTHQALVCNTLQIKSFLLSKSKETYLAAIPLFHVFGMVAVMNAAVGQSATMLMISNPRDIKEVAEVIHAYKPTVFMGVPAMYNAMNNFPGVTSGEYSLNSIRACVSGSAPLPPTTKTRFEELSGGKLVEGFGMSEMPTASHCNPVFGENRAGSIGLPFPDMEMRLVSLDDGKTEVPVGEAGELLMRGPQMMMGYHNLPDETANALRTGPDGKKWLATGDIARMDEDGYFYIVDRKKDMVLIGGFNVYPNAVEKVIAAHPAVQDVGVAGIQHPDPDKAGQEALKAWVVLKKDQQVSEKDLIDFAAKQLARYEVPTRIAFVSSLPTTTVGKVMRRELAQLDKDKTAQATGVPAEQAAKAEQPKP